MLLQNLQRKKKKRPLISESAQAEMKNLASDDVTGQEQKQDYKMEHHLSEPCTTLQTIILLPSNLI